MEQGKIIALIGIIGLMVFNFLYAKLYYKEIKKSKKKDKKIAEFESKVFIKEMPEYIKHYDNRYPSVYKIIDIRVLPQNPVTMPELCAVITGKAKDGRTLNATIDKFIEATKKEYNAGKRDELNF
jgi:hypothetical protein